MNTLIRFFKQESAPGILLVLMTIFALILQNSALSDFYTSFLHTHIEVRFGELQIAKPLLLWVNDGLMAVFFLMIGLEVKREVLEGHLSSVKQIILPGVAALGGMLVPALVFISFTQGEDFAMKGWAIPTATDIAFALGVLSLLGKRVHISLKIFLMTLAIVDDLGAIIIIAIFYTSELSTLSITIATISLFVLFAMNYFGVLKKSAYIIVGIILWISVLKSGVHATLAGVALAFLIPLNSTSKKGKKFSIAKEMEHDLHFWVIFIILPLFAFVNAGIDLRGISMSDILTPVPLGIMLGLFIGKQIGVFGFSWIAIKLGIAKLPTSSNWRQLYGVSILTGIGFTMSLFIDSLAYNDTQIYHYADKLAILLGSFLSAVVGYVLLRIGK